MKRNRNSVTNLRQEVLTLRFTKKPAWIYGSQAGEL
jgi:hypothetical protein